MTGRKADIALRKSLLAKRREHETTARTLRQRASELRAEIRSVNEQRDAEKAIASALQKQIEEVDARLWLCPKCGKTHWLNRDCSEGV
jgi:rubrerythrin